MGVAHQVSTAITMLKTCLFYTHFRQVFVAYSVSHSSCRHSGLACCCSQKRELTLRWDTGAFRSLSSSFALSFPRALAIMTTLFLACTQLTLSSTCDWHSVATFSGLVHTWNPERHLNVTTIIHHPFSNSLLCLQNAPTSFFFRIQLSGVCVFVLDLVCFY